MRRAGVFLFCIRMTICCTRNFYPDANKLLANDPTFLYLPRAFTAVPNRKVCWVRMCICVTRLGSRSPAFRWRRRSAAWTQPSCNCFPCHSFPGVAFDTESLRKTGGFFSEFGWAADNITIARVALCGKVLYDPRVGAFLRIHTSNFGSQLTLQNILPAEERPIESSSSIWTRLPLIGRIARSFA